MRKGEVDALALLRETLVDVRLSIPAPRPRTIAVPRLWIWVPDQGWRVAAMAGTMWDAQQWRTQYRARKACTLWIKAGLENHAA